MACRDGEDHPHGELTDSGELTDAELEDLIDSMSDEELAALGEDDGELTDQELEQLAGELDDAELEQLISGDPELEGLAAEFDAALANTYATAQDRQAADEHERAHPLTRDEDQLARALRRVAAGSHQAQEF